MLNNFQIEAFCSQNGIPLVDICMKDELPKQALRGNYVINLQSSSSGQSGTHWLALIVRDNINVFFDSFGAPPSQEIIAFCAKTGRRLCFNNAIIQDLDSDLCGFYCIGLLHFVTAGGDGDVQNLVNSYVNMFVDDTLDNAAILQRYFQQWCPPKNILMKKLMRSK